MTIVTNMKTLLAVRGQPTPQHGSVFEIDGSPAEFSTVYTFRKNVQYMMALLGQNSVGEPSIMGQYRCLSEQEHMSELLL